MEHMNFLFCLQTREMHVGYNLRTEKLFSGPKSDFFRILFDSRGEISNGSVHCDDLFPSGE